MKALFRQNLCGTDGLRIVREQVFRIGDNFNLYKIAASQRTGKPCDPDSLIRISCAGGIGQQCQMFRQKVQDVFRAVCIGTAQGNRCDLTAAVFHNIVNQL